MINHLFIECTHTSGTTLKTGIQRVVRKVVNEIGDYILDDTPVTLIRIENGEFYSLDNLGSGLNIDKGVAEEEISSFSIFKLRLYKLAKEKRQYIADKVKWEPLNRFLMAPRTEAGLLAILYTLSLISLYKKIEIFINGRRELISNDGPSSIVFVEGDVVLLLDSSFHLPAWKAIADGKKQGAKFIAVIYDLIPLTHPQFCEQTLTNALHYWFEAGKRYLDGYIAISKTVQKSLQDYLISIDAQVVPERLGYFYLGADVEKCEGQPDLN